MTNDQRAEIIDIVPQASNRLNRWRPVVGPEALSLLDCLDLPDESKATILQEAGAILAKCIPPTMSPAQDNGLVIGFVQSGKTLSFTTLAALARDNGYQILIVITGTSEPLFIQSTNRLLKDLRLPSRPDRKWQHFSNPSRRNNDHNAIADTLADWSDPDVPEAEKQTILITVMKNHIHLRNLIDVLSRLELHDVPALVIDDEADQAGLNTQVRQGNESTTYQRLLSLRRSLPHHTYLQYTATPQAPLLINIIDALSPTFAELLTPGPDYIGGEDLFLNHRRLVRTIPSSEIPTKRNRLTEPPDTLLYAMKVFFLGVAAGLHLEGGRGNRSMMIHPSQLTTGHTQYFHWVTQIKEHWKTLLELNPEEEERQDVLNGFQAAYSDLQSTVDDLPTFEILSSRLLHAIRRTRVELVNSTRGRTPYIDWSANYSYLLVGGQAMDRGFTVEGLTVTYMPRGIGVGNADTVQQRARFFGYKRGYLGYCRVFLENDTRDAYRSYIEHEEDIRRQLAKLRDQGKALPEWKRAFFLNRTLRPTRNSVLHLDYMRGNYSDQWFAPGAPHESDKAVESNRTVIHEFLRTLTLRPDRGNPKRTEMQKHKVAHNVSLSDAYKRLLIPLRNPRPYDSQRFTGLLLQIEAYLRNHPDATCTIYEMSSGRARERHLNSEGEIPNLFQGANYDGKEQTYPGDREIRASSEITIQVHNLRVVGPNEALDNVPTVAIFVPHNVSRDWITQNQGGDR